LIPRGLLRGSSSKIIYTRYHCELQEYHAMNIEFDPNEIRSATVPSCEKRPCFTQPSYDLNAFRDVAKTIYSHTACLSRSVRVFWADIIIVSGIEKYSGERIKTLYVGEAVIPNATLGKFYSKSEAIEKYSNYQFVMHSIYSEFTIIKQEKNINLIWLNKILKKYEQDVNIIFTDIELFFSLFLNKKQYISVPLWIPQTLLLENTWEKVIKGFSKNLRKELKRVLKRNYQFVVSQDEMLFEKFYNEMYLPYVKQRFGTLSVPNSHRSIMRDVKGKSDVLFLLQDNQVILGVLQKYNKDKMISVCSATADNLTPDMIKGAFTAMDYFSIMNAFEKGCRVVDFMGSRPLLKDGPFMYKRKWGTSIGKFHLPINDLYLKVCNFSAGVRSFFSNNPIITNNGDKYIGKVLLTEPATQPTIKHCTKNYTTTGLNHIEIFCTAGMNIEAKEYADLNASKIKLYDITNSPHPGYEFCHS